GDRNTDGDLHRRHLCGGHRSFSKDRGAKSLDTRPATAAMPKALRQFAYYGRRTERVNRLLYKTCDIRFQFTEGRMTSNASSQITFVPAALCADRRAHRRSPRRRRVAPRRSDPERDGAG